MDNIIEKSGTKVEKALDNADDTGYTNDGSCEKAKAAAQDTNF